MTYKATDWLGNEYGPGDWVLYCRTYGSGSQQLLAEVVSVNSTSVTAKVLRASRSGKDDYRYYDLIDSRTGKAVRGGRLHIKKPAHYVHKVTGEELSSSDLHERNPAYTGYGSKEPYYLHDHRDYKHIPVTYWEYVVKGVLHTTFLIKSNITKIDKNWVKLADETS